MVESGPLRHGPGACGMQCGCGVGVFAGDEVVSAQPSEGQSGKACEHNSGLKRTYCTMGATETLSHDVVWAVQQY